jgi:hypothetical protein
MVTGGQLRHHTPVAGVDLHLTVDCLGQETGLTVIEGHSRLVAGGLNAKYAHLHLCLAECWFAVWE